MVTKITDDFLVYECEILLRMMRLSSLMPIGETKNDLQRRTTILYEEGDVRRTGVYFHDKFLDDLAAKFIANKISDENVYMEVEEYKNEIISNSEHINWEKLIATADKNNLIEIIEEHYEKIPHNAYWKMIAHAYTNGNLSHIDTDNILPYFLNERPDRHCLMHEYEQEALKALPNEITIYRGCSKKEIKSGRFKFSWTTDRKIAEYFAFEYVNIQNGELFDKDFTEYDIVEKTINKKDIIAYFLGRKEFEVIYIQ